MKRREFLKSVAALVATTLTGLPQVRIGEAGKLATLAARARLRLATYARVAVFAQIWGPEDPPQDWDVPIPERIELVKLSDEELARDCWSLSDVEWVDGKAAQIVEWVG
jgi:hypothetical protein